MSFIICHEVLVLHSTEWLCCPRLSFVTRVHGKAIQGGLPSPRTSVITAAICQSSKINNLFIHITYLTITLCFGELLFSRWEKGGKKIHTGCLGSPAVSWWRWDLNQGSRIQEPPPNHCCLTFFHSPPPPLPLSPSLPFSPAPSATPPPSFSLFPFQPSHPASRSLHQIV